MRGCGKKRGKVESRKYSSPSGPDFSGFSSRGPSAPAPRSDSRMSVKPYRAGTPVYVRRSLELDALAAQFHLPLSRVHLQFCDRHAVVVSARSVDGPRKVHAFFYRLHGIPLVWPHACLEPPAVVSLEERSLTVNVKRPLPPRMPRRSAPGEQGEPSRPGVEENLLPDGFLPELYVGGVPYSVTEQGLSTFFSGASPVPTSASLRIDRQTGRSRGFGFVVYADLGDAVSALTDLHQRYGDLAQRQFVPPGEDWLRAVATVEAPPLAAFIEGLEARGTSITDIIRDFTERLAEQIARNPDDLLKIEWRDIERLLTTVFARMGFDARCGAGSHDGGVDIELRGPSGRFSVQVKHWIGTRVGAGVVSEFVQVAFRKGVASGLLLATAGFTSTAFSGVTVLEKRKLRIGTRSHMVALCQAYMMDRSGLYRPDAPEDGLMYYTDSVG
jgi:hypothetical protein